MNSARQIRPRDRDVVLQSLRAGLVPRRGLQHIQVGRAGEVEALLCDIERIADGGSAIRFIIGDYGAGKTFFLNLVRSVALEKQLVTAHADLTPDRRLQCSGGRARALYAELMRNLSSRSKPEGGALSAVVERFVSSALGQARTEGRRPDAVIQERLEKLGEMVGGYDFAQVVSAYWKGHDTGNDRIKSDAVRWLRGEFNARSDARTALGVRTIIDDAGFYDYLKLMALFVRLAGYRGLLITLDEMVNLYKINHSGSRNSNYEQVLRIFNDSLQGISVGLGFLMGGTPDLLLDTRRGLHSFEALRSRLAQTGFVREGLVDFSGPVLNLASLTQEEIFLLLSKLRVVYAAGDETKCRLPDEALYAYMEHCNRRLGEAYFRTPRATIKFFLDLLFILDQNPGVSWRELLGRLEIHPDPGPADGTNEPEEAPKEDDELATFRL
ncbi:MAG: ATP-binding protein [Deltaproteobacteria bacterium]|nr:ATP-binding protein [Deltaproteobacteria bacterium]